MSIFPPRFHPLRREQSENEPLDWRDQGLLHRERLTDIRHRQ